MKGRWTKAKTRHRGARWYWVRQGLDSEPIPAQFHGMEPDCYLRGEWRYWEFLLDEGWRRWSEPIEVPK